MRRTVIAAVLTVFGLVAAGSPAHAAPTTPDSSSVSGSAVIATFEGRHINLAQSWQGARACVEYAKDDVRCYRTDEDRRRAEGGVRALADNGNVCVYLDANYRGSSFCTKVGGKHDLVSIGFAHQVSSMTNGRQRWAGLFQNSLWTDPGYTYPPGSRTPLVNPNDWADYVYVDCSDATCPEHD